MCLVKAKNLERLDVNRTDHCKSCLYFSLHCPYLLILRTNLYRFIDWNRVPTRRKRSTLSGEISRDEFQSLEQLASGDLNRRNAIAGWGFHMHCLVLCFRVENHLSFRCHVRNHPGSIHSSCARVAVVNALRRVHI